MLATRIIPSLLVRGRELVKGERFNAWRSVGVAMQAALIHAARGVDELLILDIAATPEGRGPDLDFVRELTRQCFVPVTVGGGVRSVEDVRALLNAGADKVAIRTAAMDDPRIIRRCADKFGSQAIVVPMDIRCSSTSAASAAALAHSWEVQGAGEILLTAVEREGTMAGYDLELIREVSRAVSVPVIAHGGAGSYEHMAEAVRAGADAVAAGAMFQFTDATPKGAAQHLLRAGVEVRV